MPASTNSRRGISPFPGYDHEVGHPAYDLHLVRAAAGSARLGEAIGRAAAGGGRGRGGGQRPHPLRRSPLPGRQVTFVFGNSCVSSGHCSSLLCSTSVVCVLSLSITFALESSLSISITINIPTCPLSALRLKAMFLSRNVLKRHFFCQRPSILCLCRLITSSCSELFAIKNVQFFFPTAK